MKFSQFPKDVMEHSVKYTLREIENVIKKYGPRESATEAEFQAQRHMAKELDQWCDSVKTEEFSTSNHAFLHFTKIDSILMLLSMAAYFIIGYGLQNWIWATVVVIVGFTICYVLMFGEFLFYKEFTDRFYKQKTSHNVTAVRRPTGEVKRRIIVSGHADSAYEWSLTYHFGHIGLKVIIFGTIVLGLLMILFAISTLFVGMESPFTIYGRYVSLIGLPFYFGLYFFANFKRVVPGANDNLTGCYAAVCMMQLLEEAGVNLEHTEVVSVITGSEESGLRGAKAWAKAHAEEMKDVETIFIGADTLKDLDDFCIYARDLTGMVKHDPQVCKLIHEAAKDAGFDMEYSSVYLGASDAAAITQAGMKAACIAAMDPAPPRYYHTRLDSYDILDPKAIKAGYDVLLSTILRYDEKGLPTV